MNYQLKSRQVCFFLIAFMPITKLFVLPSMLAKTANEDMWISAVISLLVDFLTLLSIVYACKKSKTNFFGLLENSFGKVGTKIVLMMFFIYFMLKAVLPLNEQKDYVEFTLYTLKPTVFYFLPFFIVALYFCAKKLRVIGRTADIMWLITVNGFVTLIALSITNADFGAILPIGANGIGSIVKGSYSSLSWFGDVSYLLFFIGEFKYGKKDGLKIFLSFLVGAVMIIIFMVIFYCIFTSIAFRQRFALTEISKYTTVINNLGRFDYIGIIMILFVNLFCLSLPMFFSCRILNYIFKFKKPWIASAICVGIQALILLVFYQFIAGIENFMINYAGIYFFLLGNVFPIALVFIVKKGVKKLNAQG